MIDLSQRKRFLIEVGGRTALELAESITPSLTPIATRILMQQTSLPEVEEVSFVVLKTADFVPGEDVVLGLLYRLYWKKDTFLAEWSRLNLSSGYDIGLCRATDAAHLRRHYMDQPVSEVLRMGMEPVNNVAARATHGCGPFIFTLSCEKDGTKRMGIDVATPQSMLQREDGIVLRLVRA